MLEKFKFVGFGFATAVLFQVALLNFVWHGALLPH